MKRGLTGHFVPISTLGETCQAFVPHPLPPAPPLQLDEGLHTLAQYAALALGRLDALAALLPDPQVFLYSYVRKEAVLSSQIEGHAQQTEGGIEYWLARDLQHLLGYTKGDNFLNVVSKAKTACEVSGRAITDHFADVGKMVDLGSRSQREVDDLMLIRPETLQPAQDVKKIERRIASEDKKALKKPDALDS